MDKILIIQDSPSVNMMLKFRLESSGFSVDTVEAGEEGIEKAKSGEYQLILADIKLPGVDGLEVTRILKKDEGTKDTPIVLISAKEENELIKCVEDAGADGYIKEPFEGKVFVDKIKGFIENA